MPLPKPAARQMLHLRDITLRGYAREDGLVDIEAHMTDVKTNSTNNRDRGGLPAGEPVHDMWLRITIGEDMVITECQAAMDGTPYSVCPGVAPNFARLAGLTIGRGFLKGATQRVGGVEGCTHLRELLHQIGTVAYQTMFGIRMQKQTTGKDPKTIPASLLNTCYTYNEHGPLAAG